MKAFGITFHIPDMTPEQYHHVKEQINPVVREQPGFILHISGPAESGYRITEVWKSEADQNRFARNRSRRSSRRSRFRPPRWRRLPWRMSSPVDTRWCSQNLTSSFPFSDSF